MCDSPDWSELYFVYDDAPDTDSHIRKTKIIVTIKYIFFLMSIKLSIVFPFDRFIDLNDVLVDRIFCLNCFRWCLRKVFVLFSLHMHLLFPCFISSNDRFISLFRNLLTQNSKFICIFFLVNFIYFSARIQLVQTKKKK